MENEMKQVELTAEELDAQLERMREELGDEEFNKEFYIKLCRFPKKLVL